MAIKNVIPKSKEEQLAAFTKLDALSDEAEAGMPTGGTTGQVLTKGSSTDYDADWAAPAAPADDSITDAKIKSDAAIASSKLAAGTDIAALTAARANPVAYSVDPANIAAVLVALGVMEADAG